jgi:hypothetical protein
MAATPIDDPLCCIRSTTHGGVGEIVGLMFKKKDSRVNFQKNILQIMENVIL